MDGGVYSNQAGRMELEVYPRYQGHCLRPQMAMTVVGKLVSINTKRASLLLETSHDSKTQVEALAGENAVVEDFQVGSFYQVRGVGRSAKEIEMRGFTYFGNDFDLESYNTMLELAVKEFKVTFGYPS